MKRAWVLWTILLLGLLLSGCGADRAQVFRVSGDPYDPYAGIIPQSMPDFEVRAFSATGIAGVAEGDAAAVMGVQMGTGISQGIVAHWYPQYLATVVIAVDRSRTDTVVTGWGGLSDIPDAVGYLNGYYSLAAMAYGLSGDVADMSRAKALLAGLRDQNRLVLEGYDAPVFICYDYQAAALRKAGRSLDIVVPAEGTLTYTRGVVSGQALDFPADMALRLLAAGCRLTDGRCIEALYAPASDYARARLMTMDPRFAASGITYANYFRREVLKTRRYSSADAVEHIFFVLAVICLIILWEQFEVRRIMQPDLRRLMRAAAVLLAGWAFLRMVKYQVSWDVLNRMLWYSYYWFQLLLSFVTLLTALTLGRADGLRQYLTPKREAAAIGVLAVLMGMVLSNDFHHLVFSFDPADLRWSSNYTYGPLAVVLWAALYLPVAAAIVLFIAKSLRRGNRTAIVSTLLFFSLLIGYTAAYLMGVPVARDSDLVLTIIVFFLLYFEIALRSGFIPTNRHYALFFDHAHLRLQLIGSDGVTRFATPDAGTVSAQVLGALALHSPVEADGATLVFGRAIRGGMAVWQEDIRPIRELEAELGETREKLRRTGVMLAGQCALAHAQEAERARTAILGRLMDEIGDELTAVDAGLRSKAQAGFTTLEVARLTLDLCYIKRKCQLFFKAQSCAVLEPEALTRLMAELGELGAYCGVRAAAVLQPQRPAAVFPVMALYEYYYRLIRAASSEDTLSLLVFLTQKADGLEFAVSADESRWVPVAAPAGCGFETFCVDGLCSSVVTLPGGALC